MQYEYTEFPGRPLDEYNDCVVRAMSLAADVPYELAHRILAKTGRKKGKPTSDRRMDKAAEMLGLEKQFPKKQGTKISNFVKRTDQDKIIAVAVWGHLVAMKGDIELDLWQYTKPGKTVRFYYVKKR